MIVRIHPKTHRKITVNTEPVYYNNEYRTNTCTHFTKHVLFTNQNLYIKSTQNNQNGNVTNYTILHWLKRIFLVLQVSTVQNDGFANRKSIFLVSLLHAVESHF